MGIEHLDIEKHCDLHISDEPDATIFLFHGLNSTRHFNRPLMNYLSRRKNVNIFNCDARGYGSRRDVSEDWIKTIEDYRNYFDKNPHKNLVLIGKSFGGALPFQLHDFNPKSIFVVGGLHDNNLDIGWFHRLRIGPKVDKVNKKYQHLAPCFSGFQNTSKLHLIHSTKDRVVPFSQFEANVDFFNVPKERQFVIEHQFPFFTHWRTMNNRDGWDFILEHLPIDET